MKRLMKNDKFFNNWSTKHVANSLVIGGIKTMLNDHFSLTTVLYEWKKEVFDPTFGTHVTVKAFIKSVETDEWFHGTFKFVPSFNCEDEEDCENKSWVPHGYNDALYRNHYNLSLDEYIRIDCFSLDSTQDLLEQMIMSGIPEWGETITKKTTDYLFKSFDMSLVKFKKKSPKLHDKMPFHGKKKRK